MSISYDACRIFCEVAMAGSFTRAADLLSNSQPNLTRIVHNLENELSCPLLIRTRQGVVLTPEGQILYDAMQEMAGRMQEAESRIRRQAMLQEGIVHLAASEIALHSILLPVLSRFRSQYPKIEIQMEDIYSAEAEERIRNGKADLALSTLAKPPAGVQALELAAFEDVLIAPPGTEKKGAVRKREIGAFPIIAVREGSASYALQKQFFEEEGLPFHPAVTVTTVTQILPMVHAGLGVAFLPAFLAEDALAKGQAVRIETRDRLPMHRVYLLQRPTEGLFQAARRFLELLMQNK